MNSHTQDHQEYLVPAGYGEALFVEKRSRFIGRVWLCEEEQEALARIAEIRKKHGDATHNVYAYIVNGGRTLRYSDDGEPQGTSGLPTLGVFQNESVFNVCCIITRYFGGTLLSSGGLVRAYSKTAKMALDEAGISSMRRWNLMLIPCPYSFYERVRNMIVAYEGAVESTDFAADVLLEVLLPFGKTGEFQRQLTELSAGTIEAVIADTIFRGVRIR